MEKQAIPETENDNVDYGLLSELIKTNIADLYAGSESVKGQPLGKILKVIRFLSLVSSVGSKDLKLADVWIPFTRPSKALNSYKRLLAESQGVDGVIWLDKNAVEIFDDVFKEIHESTASELLVLVSDHEMAQKDSLHALAFKAIMSEPIVDLRMLLSQVNSKIPRVADELELSLLKDQIAERVRSI